MKKRLILLLCTFFMFNLNRISAQDYTWFTISSKLDITSAAKSGSVLFYGTRGGLISVDLNTFNMSGYTKTEGLADQHITAAASIGDSIVWMGFYSGMLQMYNLKTGIWKNIDDYLGNEITYIDPAGDSLFVGLDIGVSLYIISRSEVKETYRHLGDNVPRDVPVRNIVHNKEKIWAVTDYGITTASVYVSNLLDPSSWGNITVSTSLDGKEINDLKIDSSGNLFAAAENGVYTWNGSAWTKVFSEAVISMCVTERGLYLSTESGLYYPHNSAFSAADNCPGSLQFLIWDGTKIWGVDGRYICSYNPQNADLDSLVIDCIGSDLITSCFLDNSGNEWVCSRGAGFFSKQDEKWVYYNKSNTNDLLSDEIMCITQDDSSNIWVGTWGGGAYTVDSDKNLRRFHPKDGFLAGVSEDHNYSVITDILKDKNGSVWMLNYRAVNGLPLVCVNSGKFYYFGAANGITSIKLKSLSIDQYGRKWIGSEDKGVFMFDDSGTIDNLQDDMSGNITTLDGLGSNTVNAIACSPDGTVLAGTPNGLYSIFGNSVTRMYGLISENIKDIVVDGAGNIWVATDAGLNVLLQSQYKWRLYTKDDSYLVSNDISSLYFNGTTGKLYISTISGVSIIQTPYSVPFSTLNTIRVFPNPFLSSTQKKVVIDGLSVNSYVAIYSASGYLIRSFSEQEVVGRQILWDGKDGHGNDVASGIYIVVVVNIKGEKAAAKLAVVR